MAWHSGVVRYVCSTVDDFSVTVELVLLVDDSRMAVTSVYAPCAYDLQPLFLNELVHLAGALTAVPWLVFWDCNLMRDSSDRKNGKFDAASALSFNSTVDTVFLQELPFSDRQFTWSNCREVTTLVRLDRAFINAAWGHVLFNSVLSSLPHPTSDHVLIIVAAASRVPVSCVFLYEKTWAFVA